MNSRLLKDQGTQRVVPAFATAGITRLPLLLVLGYIIATFAMFLVWPIDWPVYYSSEWLRLVGYVGLCFAIIAVTMVAGSAGPSRLNAPIAALPLLLAAGAAAAAALLIPASFAYTNRGPWDLLDALRDQGAAYRRLQVQLYATEGQRNTIVAMRALAAPLTFAVLPLGIIHWRSIGTLSRVAVGVTVTASMIFSILRGTDKEIADLFIVGIAASFVAYGRNRTVGRKGFEIVRRFWKAGLVAAIFLYLAQGLFTERKDERLGGYVSRTAVCVNESRVCANLDNPWISWLPLRQRFGLTFFILSTSSGYYGLALALEKPFEPAYGIGHSPAAASVYEAVTGDTSLHMRTYTYRNGADRWPEDNYWSTLVTWIANDVGFLGALPVLGLIGYFWGRWWREAAAGMSDPAAVLFCVATMMMFYFPANDQVLASYDGYTILLSWVGIWLWHRRAAAISAVVAS